MPFVFPKRGANLHVMSKLIMSPQPIVGTHLLRVAEREAVIHKHVKIHEQGEGGGVGWWVVGVGWGGGGGWG